MPFPDQHCRRPAGAGVEAWIDRDGGGMAPPVWVLPSEDAVAEASRWALQARRT